MKYLITESQFLNLSERARSNYPLRVDFDLEDDGFKNDHSNDPRKYLFNELHIVKKEFTDMLNTPLSSTTQWNSVSDIYSSARDYMIRIMRLRMLIEPDYLFQKTTHPVTHHTYIVMTAYWLNDDGTKHRVKKSLGNVNDIVVNGKISDDVVQKGKHLIDELLWNKYRETYNR